MLQYSHYLLKYVCFCLQKFAKLPIAFNQRNLIDRLPLTPAGNARQELGQGIRLYIIVKQTEIPNCDIF